MFHQALDASEEQANLSWPTFKACALIFTDDLSELSIQTDQFARKHTKPLDQGPQPSISPDGLNSSSRSSSYSSIVSSSSGEGNGKNKDKRYPAGFSPYSDALTGMGFYPPWDGILPILGRLVQPLSAEFDKRKSTKNRNDIFRKIIISFLLTGEWQGKKLETCLNIGRKTNWNGRK